MKKVLLIIDPQNDFIWGSLPVEGAKDAMNKLSYHLASNKLYDQIIITADMHPDNHCSFIENGGSWPSHCVRHTTGCCIHKQLRSVIDVLYPKNHLILDKGLSADHEEYSILKNIVSKGRLLPLLQNAEEIHICGIAGNFCVLETIKDLINLGFKDVMVIHPEYIASTDSGIALKELVSKHNLKCL